MIVFSHWKLQLQFISCRQGRTPRGQTKRVIYLRPLDHLRVLKIRLLCKIKQSLNEDEYVMKNHHHHHGHCYY